MKRKLIALLLGAVLVFALDCTDPTPGGNNPETITPVYEPLTVSPDYAEVDLAGYTTYYIDSALGEDANNGLTELEPKQSLSSANYIIAGAGAVPTRILFKAGSEFSGTLTVSGITPTDSQPLLIGCYAATDEVQYAKITSSSDCVKISASNVRISGLECVAPTGNRGFYVETVRAGALKNIVICGNYIHDINFNWTLETSPEETAIGAFSVTDICATNKYQYHNGGIIFRAATLAYIGASWFENVWIEDNLIERVARSGMFIDSQWTLRPGLNWGYNHYYSDEIGWYPQKNVNIRRNTINYSGGDGIVLLSTDGGYIENNTCIGAQFLGRSGYFNAGIWTHSCKNVVFQYNEAAYTFKRNGAGDGQGFDIDIGNSNITFRFNYSHHNEGGGILLCNVPTQVVRYDENGNQVLDEDNLPILESRIGAWENVAMRNNVFAYNMESVITVSGPVWSFEFANNTVLLSGDRRENIIVSGDHGGSNSPGVKWRIDNNIFYLKNTRAIGFDASFCRDCTLSNNVFYNFEENFLTRIDNNLNPLTFDPGFGDTLAADGWEAAAAFAPNSAALDCGKPLEIMSAVDYLGNAANERNYVGAICVAKN